MGNKLKILYFIYTYVFLYKLTYDKFYEELFPTNILHNYIYIIIKKFNIIYIVCYSYFDYIIII